MADLDERDSAGNSKIVGADSLGNETDYVKVSPNQEMSIRDTHDNGGLDAVLALDAITAVEGKVGALTKDERKYVIMEALSTNVKWGFSNSTQSFDLFKSQLIMVPVGPNTEIWFIMASGTGSVAFGELS
jgi:hypothetical protein